MPFWDAPRVRPPAKRGVGRPTGIQEIKKGPKKIENFVGKSPKGGETNCPNYGMLCLRISLKRR